MTQSSLAAIVLTAFACLTLPALHAAPQPLIDEVETSPLNSNAILPKIISQTAALYPAALARTGTEAVVVSFTVTSDGKVENPKIISTPATQLEAPAKKAVLAWKFQPGSRLGKPADFRLKAPVTFSVNGDGIEDAPAASRKVAAVYPYEQLVKNQTGWGEVAFVVDYSGRAILASSTGASDAAFSKSVIAMLEATEFSPAKKDKRTVMAPSTNRENFRPDADLDFTARHVLSELRKPKPAIFNLADLDDRPKAVSQRSAVYPRSMKSDGLTGQAEIEFIVDRDGRVLFPRIVSSSHEDFGWAAATAVAQWKFNPPMRNGQRVDVRMTVPVMFDAQKLASSD
ncbi:energy transducer TonB [Nibricoccus aquaticus]|nr:energy transducer TonB [Nibricoccus aquaticus]